MYGTDWEQAREERDAGTKAYLPLSTPTPPHPSPPGQLKQPLSPSAQLSQVPCPNPGLTAALGATALSIFQEFWGSPRGKWTPPGFGPSQADPSSFLFGKGPKVLSITPVHLSSRGDGG